MQLYVIRYWTWIDHRARWQGPSTWAGDHGGFLTPYQAERAWETQVIARSPSGDDGYRYKWEPVPMDWHFREQKMFDLNFYRPVPWMRERLWQGLGHVWGDHYPHVATKDPTMLAFTPSPEDGERDRQAIMKPGRYLQKYFGAGKKGVIADGPLKGQPPVMTERQIAYYAEWWAKGSRPSPIDGCEVQFARTPDEIADIYIGGPRSCMGGRSSGYVGGFLSKFKNRKLHPTRVYGAGDLAVAYIKTLDGRIGGRALCWPDKEVFGRVYPSTENWSNDGWQSESESALVQEALRAKLKAMGWTDILEEGNVFDGARLLKVKVDEHTGHRNSYLMPYLDNGYKFDDPGNADYFYLKLEGMHTGGTAGWSMVVPKFECDNCHATKPLEDNLGRLRWRRVASGWSEKDGLRDEQRWCADCAAYGELRYCAGTDTHYKRSRSIQMVTGWDGRTYLKTWMLSKNAYKCHAFETWHLPETHPPVECEGRTYCPEAAESYTFFCTWDERHYMLSDMSSRYSGFPAKYDDAEIHPGDRAVHSCDVERFVLKDGSWVKLDKPKWHAHFLRRREARLRSENAARLNTHHVPERAASSTSGTTPITSATTRHAVRSATILAAE